METGYSFLNQSLTGRKTKETRPITRSLLQAVRLFNISVRQEAVLFSFLLMENI